MKKFGLLLLIVLVLNIISCSKSNQFRKSAAGDISGTWKLAEVNSNDYWGGPFYWSPIDEEVKCRFTEDGRYLRKQAGESTFKQIGTYIILPDDKIEITKNEPASTDITIYTLDFIVVDDLLIMGTGRTETVIQEKFRRE